MGGGGPARPQEQKTCANNSLAQSCQTRTGTRSNTFPTSSRPPPPLPPRCRRRRERRSAEVGTGSRSAERSSPFVRTNPQTIPGPAGRHSSARGKNRRGSVFNEPGGRPRCREGALSHRLTHATLPPPPPPSPTPHSGLNSITASQKKFQCSAISFFLHRSQAP